MKLINKEDWLGINILEIFTLLIIFILLYTIIYLGSQWEQTIGEYENNINKPIWLNQK